jgi:hypothetical protein
LFYGAFNFDSSCLHNLLVWDPLAYIGFRL